MERYGCVINCETKLWDVVEYITNDCYDYLIIKEGFQTMEECKEFIAEFTRKSK